jgi:integrase
MAVFKRGSTYWYEFVFVGKRIRESAKTTRKSIAVEAERAKHLQLERSLAGVPVEKRENRIHTVLDMVKPYELHHGLNHRKSSTVFAKGRLAHVKRLLGNTLIPDLTESAIKDYITKRLDEEVSGRTINMELGELSRAIGKPWSVLWPKVRKLEERKDVGKALSDAEQGRLLDVAAENRSRLIAPFIKIALLTGMRSGEIVSLTWGQVDFGKLTLTVGRAKTASGTGRQIPINTDLLEVLNSHAAWFAKEFGQVEPQLFLFPFGKGRTPHDPTRPVTDITSAWHSVRKDAAVSARLHDLRHTVLTRWAEAGVPESTMLALAGHMSRAMLERYSHIRMAAKRTAVEHLTLRPRTAEVPTLPEAGNVVPTKAPTIPGLPHPESPLSY